MPTVSFALSLRHRFAAAASVRTSISTECVVSISGTQPTLVRFSDFGGYPEVGDVRVS